MSLLNRINQLVTDPLNNRNNRNNRNYRGLSKKVFIEILFFYLLSLAVCGANRTDTLYSLSQTAAPLRLLRLLRFITGDHHHELV